MCDRTPYVVLGHGATDGDGRFRIEASRTSSARFFDVYALAAARRVRRSAGPSSTPTPSSPRPRSASGPSRSSAAGWSTSTASRPPGSRSSSRAWAVCTGKGTFDSVSPSVNGALPRSSAPGRSPSPPTPRAGSPSPASAAAHVSLHVRDPRFAQQDSTSRPTTATQAKEVTLALQPATIIEGRALAADTGQPIPDAVIAVRASSGKFGGWFTTKFRADDQGGSRSIPTRATISACVPSPRGPALPGPAGRIRVDQGGGQERDRHHASPRRADPGQGDRGGDRPARGRGQRAVLPDGGRDDRRGFEAIVASKDDGSFQVAVPPGKGHLMVLGPTLDYIPEEIGGGKLYASGQPGGVRFYAHDIIAYEVKAGDGPTSSPPRCGRARRCRAAWSAPRGRPSRTR